VTATSASWKVTARAWRTTRAPILISLICRLVKDQSAMASDSSIGRMVAAGEWRDYGISTLRDVAIFSVFRRTAEHPLYRIEKRPKLRAKQGLYAVVAMDGQILRRGHDLGLVLKVLERKLIRTID